VAGTGRSRSSEIYALQFRHFLKRILAISALCLLPIITLHRQQRKVFSKLFSEEEIWRLAGEAVSCAFPVSLGRTDVCQV